MPKPEETQNKASSGINPQPVINSDVAPTKKEAPDNTKSDAGAPTSAGQTTTEVSPKVPEANAIAAPTGGKNVIHNLSNARKDSSSNNDNIGVTKTGKAKPKRSQKQK